MALLEKEATRFAVSLDDYEHVSITDIGGWGPIGFRLVVRDQRFERDYEIASHCDYWDFIGAFVERVAQMLPVNAANRGRSRLTGFHRSDYDLTFYVVKLLLELPAYRRLGA